MDKLKRLVCLALTLVLASVPLMRARAAESVIFTAVNDTLLPLSDETMPIVSGGALYAASSAFDGTDLGVYYNRSRDRATAVLYKQRSVLVFDLAAGTIEGNNGEAVYGAAITRGDAVFLPVDTVCRYFNLEYTFSRISYGYLLRIKNDAVVLSDAKFIDAANAAMASRYARYGRAQQEETPPPPPTAEEEPPAPPAPVAPPRETAQRTAYLVMECTDPEQTEPLLDRFGGGQVTCLFTPERLAGADALLRRLASGAGGIALRVDASGGAEDAVSRIEAGNRALWEAANSKTRLVWLDGASDETVRRVAAAGYCPVRAALSLSGSRLSVSGMSARVFAAADGRGGRCCVFLGTDAAVAGNLSALLASLRAGNCTAERLNEVTA